MALKLNKTIIWILILSILLFFPSKTILGLLSTVEIALVFSIIALYLQKSTIKIIIPNYHFLLFVGVLIFSSLSFIVKKSSFENISYLLRLFEYLFFMIFFYWLTNKRILNTIKYALLSSLWLLLFWALLQILIPESINYFDWGPVWKSKYVESNFIRIFSLLDNPLNLLGYLAIILGVIHYIELRYRYLYIVVVYFIIILTASKMGFILILLSLITLFIIHFRNNSVKSRLVGVLFLLLSITVLVFVLKYSNSILYRRVVNDVNNTESSKRVMINNTDSLKKASLNKQVIVYQDSSLIKEDAIETGGNSQRKFVLMSSIKMLRNNWFWGIGAGNFDKVYNNGYKYPNASDEVSSFTAENYFLDFYLDNGLIPLMLILILFASIIARGYKSKSLWNKGMALALVYFIVVGLVTNLRVAPVNLLLFSLIGIFVKLSSIDDSYSEE